MMTNFFQMYTNDLWMQFNTNAQVLLVTGGYDHSDLLASTEVSLSSGKQ